jgi:hypothetical protein
VSSTDPPAFGAAERLFDTGRYAQTHATRSFDISPDGQKFLFIHAEDLRRAPLPTRIHLVLNWTDEVKRKLGR